MLFRSCHKYYISKNIFYEIIGSIIVYNLISIIYISVIFLILCLFSGAGGNDNCCNDLHMNSFNNGTERLKKIHIQNNKEINKEINEQNIEV